MDLGSFGIGAQSVGTIKLNGTPDLGSFGIGAQSVGTIKLQDSTLSTYEIIGLRLVNGGIRLSSFGIKFLR